MTAYGRIISIGSAGDRGRLPLEYCRACRPVNDHTSWGLAPWQRAELFYWDPAAKIIRFLTSIGLTLTDVLKHVVLATVMLKLIEVTLVFNKPKTCIIEPIFFRMIVF